MNRISARTRIVLGQIALLVSALMLAIALVTWTVLQIPQPSEPPAYAVYQPVEVPPQDLFEISNTATAAPTPSPGPTVVTPANTIPAATASETPNAATPTPQENTATPPPTEPAEPTSENTGTVTPTP